jgi:hypothetical protein
MWLSSFLLEWTIRLQPSVTWHCVVWLIGTNILEEPATSIFMLEKAIQILFCSVSTVPNRHSNHSLTAVPHHFIIALLHHFLRTALTVPSAAIYWNTKCLRARGSVVLCYKPKVTGSIPDQGIAFFNWLNPSSRTMALGLIQPLREMGSRNLPGG